MVVCAIQGCNSHSRYGISFIKIPYKHPEVTKKWVKYAKPRVKALYAKCFKGDEKEQIISLRNINSRYLYRVCVKHFAEHDFEPVKPTFINRNKLYPHAFPTTILKDTDKTFQENCVNERTRFTTEAIPRLSHAQISQGTQTESLKSVATQSLNPLKISVATQTNETSDCSTTVYEHEMKLEIEELHKLYVLAVLKDHSYPVFHRCLNPLNPIDNPTTKSNTKCISLFSKYFKT